MSATSITCSPKTIVVAEVDCASGRRNSASVPHNVAASAMSTIPGMVAIRRDIPASVPPAPRSATRGSCGGGGAGSHETRPPPNQRAGATLAVAGAPI